MLSFFNLCNMFRSTLDHSFYSSNPLCVLPVRQTVEKLLDLLGTLDQWINETPPVDQPSRFGNKAFRTWYSKLDQVCTQTDSRKSSQQGAINLLFF